MTEDKLVGSVYFNIIKDKDGKIKFAYGYDIDYNEVNLQELAMLNSQLQTWKDKAQEDYNERLEISEKEFSIEKK